MIKLKTKMCSISNIKICLVSITKLLETIQTLLSLYLWVTGTWEVLLKKYNKLIQDEKLKNVYMYVYHYMSSFLGELQSRGTKIHALVLCTLARILESMISFAEVTLSYPFHKSNILGLPLAV